MEPERIKLLGGILVIGSVVVFVLLYKQTPAIGFQPDRQRIYLITGTFFHTEKTELQVINEKWHIIENNFGLPIAISTPYSMRFNDIYEVILEPYGKLALVAKDHLRRSEMKWGDGRWLHKDPSTDEWLEFPDFEDIDYDRD